MYLIDFDFHLLQIHICSCKANNYKCCTVQSYKFFSSYFIDYISYQKMFWINTVNPNETCILLHTNFPSSEPFRNVTDLVWTYSKLGATVDQYGCKLTSPDKFWFIISRNFRSPLQGCWIQDTHSTDKTWQTNSKTDCFMNVKISHYNKSVSCGSCSSTAVCFLVKDCFGGVSSPFLCFWSCFYVIITNL